MTTQRDTDPDLGPLSRDGILNRALYLWQPEKGYRFATDAVFLAAHVDALPGQRVLDVGCGVGTVGLALAWRCRDISLTGCDIDPALVHLARRNAVDNNMPAQYFQIDVLAGVTREIVGQFDHVVCNPPFHDRSASRLSPDAGRARALAAPAQDLACWVRFCAAAAQEKGLVHMIVRADRQGELEETAAELFSGWRVRQLCPGSHKPATRVLVSLEKASISGVNCLPPLFLHEIDGKWTPNASRILGGAGFSQLD